MVTASCFNSCEAAGLHKLVIATDRIVLPLPGCRSPARCWPAYSRTCTSRCRCSSARTSDSPGTDAPPPTPAGCPRQQPQRPSQRRPPRRQQPSGRSRTLTLQLSLPWMSWRRRWRTCSGSSRRWIGPWCAGSTWHRCLRSCSPQRAAGAARRALPSLCRLMDGESRSAQRWALGRSAPRR